MNYFIHGERVDSILLKQMKLNGSIKCSELREPLMGNMCLSEQDKIYTSGETALRSILERLQSEQKKAQIQSLKDKYTFRKLIAPLFPSFKFCCLDQVKSHSLWNGDSCIVKPRDGFFGVGVQKLDRQSLQHFEVTDPSAWIVEECIGGEEYSVDLYYDSAGEPVILNICHHPEHSDSRFSNALYYTSESVFKDLYQPVLKFLHNLREIFQFRSFPIHAEFKYCKDMGLIPIELNPLRFGGFGLAELPFHAFRFNPVELFFSDHRPDWKQIWRGRESCFYGWVLRYNPAQSFLDIGSPNHLSFQERFEKVLHYKEIDFKSHPVCGIAYVRESSKDALFRVLKLDFESVA